MADVRLASYSDLQLEIESREAADTTLSQRIEEVSSITVNGIENLEELESALDARLDEAEDVIESLNTDSLTRKIVQNLPSDSLKYTFNDGVSRFTNSYRTSCYITEDDGGSYQSVINSGNSNTYRRAYLSCAELMNDATKILVEFDTKFGDRWQIGLADLDQRPGTSTGSDYTAPGVADKSYSPLYDYENRCSKYVKSAAGVLLLNGTFMLDVSGVVVYGKRWSELEFEADIAHLSGFINHETMYFTGYIEFVTPKENLKEV